MVKSIAYTLTAIALCIGLFIFTELYLHNQFNEFHDALNALYTKIEDETATRSDALAVKAIVLVLAAFGIANMWLAVFADVGVAFIAILNAMRCLRVEKLHS